MIGAGAAGLKPSWRCDAAGQRPLQLQQRRSAGSNHQHVLEQARIAVINDDSTLRPSLLCTGAKDPLGWRTPACYSIPMAESVPIAA